MRFAEGGTGPAEAPAAAAPISATAAASFDHGDLSPTEAATLASWQADGLAPADGVAEVVEPALPAAQAHEFDLPPMRDDGQPYGEADTAADTAIRSWMVAADLPKGVGSFIASEAKTLAPQIMAMDAPARELFKQQERTKLEALWKGDAFDKNLTAARQLVREIEAKQPGIVDFLERSGLGDSSLVIGLLASHAATRRK